MPSPDPNSPEMSPWSLTVSSIEDRPGISIVTVEADHDIGFYIFRPTIDCAPGEDQSDVQARAISILSTAFAGLSAALAKAAADRRRSVT